MIEIKSLDDLSKIRVMQTTSWTVKDMKPAYSYPTPWLQIIFMMPVWFSSGCQVFFEEEKNLFTVDVSKSKDPELQRMYRVLCN